MSDELTAAEAFTYQAAIDRLTVDLMRIRDTETSDERVDRLHERGHEIGIIQSPVPGRAPLATALGVEMLHTIAASLPTAMLLQQLQALTVMAGSDAAHDADDPDVEGF